MGFPEAIGPGYATFCYTLLGMLYAGWIIAMGAYWSRRNELVMRVRSPAMVMMHATYAMMMITMMFVRDSSNFGNDFPCVPVMWMSQMIAPFFGAPHLLRGFRLWILATPSARKLMPYVSNRSLILTVFALAIFPHGVMGLLFQFLYPDYYENRTGCLIDKEFYIYFPLPVLYVGPLLFLAKKLKAVKDFYSVSAELKFVFNWVGFWANLHFLFNALHMYSPWFRDVFFHYMSPHWPLVFSMYISSMRCLVGPILWDQRTGPTPTQPNKGTASGIKAAAIKATWSLDEVLADSEATKMLLDFAKDYLTIESVMFLLDVKAYRAQVLARDNLAQDKEMVRTLKPAYLKPGRSPYEVNISGNALQACKIALARMDSLTQAGRAEVFSSAEKEVFQLVRWNLLEIFLAFPPFVSYVESRDMVLQSVTTTKQRTSTAGTTTKLSKHGSEAGFSGAHNGDVTPSAMVAWSLHPGTNHGAQQPDNKVAANTATGDNKTAATATGTPIAGAIASSQQVSPSPNQLGLMMSPSQPPVVTLTVNPAPSTSTAAAAVSVSPDGRVEFLCAKPTV